MNNKIIILVLFAVLLVSNGTADWTPSTQSSDFYFDIAAGEVFETSVVHKFGVNENIKNTWTPVTTTGTYLTPQIALTTTIVSNSAEDDVGGSGALSVVVQGLNASWELTIEEVALNGTSAVTLQNQYTRIFRAWVNSTNVYANQTSGSHVGTITINTDQGQGNSSTWGNIGIIDGFAAGQSEIGAYTIPAGYTGYLTSKNVYVDSNKFVDVSMFKRENIDDNTPPYSGVMRLLEHDHGLQDAFQIQEKTPMSVFPEKTDVGFLAKTSSGNAGVAVQFEIILVKNEQ